MDLGEQRWRRIAGAAGALIVSWASAAGATIDVVPPEPTTADVVRVTASGSMPNPCYDVASTVSRSGERISIHVQLTAQPVICIQVLGSWQVVHEIGPLAEGPYRVDVEVAGLPWTVGAFESAEFTVSAATGSTGVEAVQCAGDCDGDGTVTIEELTQGLRIILDRFSALNCPALDPPMVSGLVRAVRRALEGCPPPTIADFSAVDRFELFRGTGYGYCPPIGSVVAASIVRTGEANFVLKRSFVELGNAEMDECVINPGLTPYCYLARVETCRTLTAEEAAAVHAALAAVMVLPGPVRGCGFEDPCLTTRVRFDATVMATEACSRLRIPDEEVERLVALADALGTGAEQPCPPGLCGPGDHFLCNDGNRFDGDGCAADCTDE
jgi:hypothetical protein